MTNEKNLKDFYYLLDKAFEEDLSIDGDLTSKAIFQKEDKSHAILIAKEDCILFGIDYLKLVFLKRNKDIEFIENKSDKDEVYKGETVIQIIGNTISILEAERVALNFLSFLSGIASKTNKLVSLGKECLILDTRKTLPAYRRISKEAVLAGGGQNHRMGLYDMVMIKDNHIDAAGSILDAVKKVKDRYGDLYKIEVECRNEEEVKEAINSKADIVMLDNISFQDSKEIIKRYKSLVKFECSGDMNEEKINLYKDALPDYISVGLLTHSVKGIDFSLKIKKSS